MFAAKKVRANAVVRNMTSLTEMTLARSTALPTLETNSRTMGTIKMAKYDGFTNEDGPPIDIHPKVMAKSFLNLPVWVNSLNAARDKGAVA
jgi:hypothetical protein